MERKKDNEASPERNEPVGLNISLNEAAWVLIKGMQSA